MSNKKIEFKWKVETCDRGLKFTNIADEDKFYFIWECVYDLVNNVPTLIFGEANEVPYFDIFNGMNKIAPFGDNYGHLINWGLSSDAKFLVLRFKYRMIAFFVNIPIKDTFTRGAKASAKNITKVFNDKRRVNEYICSFAKLEVQEECNQPIQINLFN